MISTYVAAVSLFGIIFTVANVLAYHAHQEPKSQKQRIRNPSNRREVADRREPYL